MKMARKNREGVFFFFFRTRVILAHEDVHHERPGGEEQVALLVDQVEAERLMRETHVF
jgi:hypothetical protein